MSSIPPIPLGGALLPYLGCSKCFAELGPWVLPAPEPQRGAGPPPHWIFLCRRDWLQKGPDPSLAGQEEGRVLNLAGYVEDGGHTRNCAGPGRSLASRGGPACL